MFGRKILAVAATALWVITATATSATASDAEHGITAGDRFNDTSPHFGGAYITDNVSAACTAGFSVLDAGGFPASVTAGHCGVSGTNFFAAGFYGQVRGRILGAAGDMARLDWVFQPVTYAPTIHTGPSAPVTRTVKGKADPGDNQLVCVSGAFSEAKCNVRVLPGGPKTVCELLSTGLVCVNGLLEGERLDASIVTPGDSGGPVYTRSGASGAIINGMIVAMGDSHHVYFHPISVVERGLGVRVMTG